MRVRSSSWLMAVALAGVLSVARAEVTVDHPWIRGTVGGQSTTGAFMTIRSTEATELIRVSSPAAASAALHKMVMADSMMSMEPVASLPIPAHGEVELKPGTYHVMLVGLKRRLAAGSSVPLILTFRGVDRVERSITVQAKVSGLAAEAPGTKM